MSTDERESLLYFLARRIENDNLLRAENPNYVCNQLTSYAKGITDTVSDHEIRNCVYETMQAYGF